MLVIGADESSVTALSDFTKTVLRMEKWYCYYRSASIRSEIVLEQHSLKVETSYLMFVAAIAIFFSTRYCSSCPSQDCSRRSSSMQCLLIRSAGP